MRRVILQRRIRQIEKKQQQAITITEHVRLDKLKDQFEFERRILQGDRSNAK